MLDDAVATQDTVTQLVAAIRRVIRDAPGGEKTATAWCTVHDYTDPGKPRIAWNDEQARAALVDALVTDALNLLGRLPERQLDEKAADAVGLPALVAGQDVEVADDSDGRDGRWRIARGTAHDRMVSTVAPQARHIHKNRTRHQDGFRAHGAFEPETGLLTEVELTAGSGKENHEAAVAEVLLADESEDLTVLGDTAYGTGDLREALETAGRTKALGRPDPTGARTAQFKKLCHHCPLQEQCTRSKTGRTFQVHSHYDRLKAARRQAADPNWKAEYRRWRPPVERAMAWLTARGNREAPYRGVLKNNTWLHNRAAALNLRRLINLGLTHTDHTWPLAPTTT
ncbi:transposase [Kitasatospora purpeofusca]|uniref:transposase n=1 Tax=Kitasatospora purpeofusca TaxID=67352 RepID=UPI0036D21670